jgi:DNA (cytosine-5)-methyltransferase 1
MSALRIGSLCSGYGGLDLAVHEAIGGELAWVADIDPGASAVLAHHFPDVPNMGDVTAAEWDSVEQVDIMGGGFPCQDVSAAGARAGLKRGNRSGVWHEFVRAVAAQRPRMVVIENVLGLLTARGDEPTPEHLAAEASRDTAARLLGWLDNELYLAVGKGDAQRARGCREREARVRKAHKRAVARCQWHEQRLIRAIGTVLADLHALGYDAEWVVVTASAAGACHRRARVFILAFPAAGRAVRGVPVAVIEDGAWLEPQESLFGAAPFTGRVPASGRMAGGIVYAAEAGPTTAGAGMMLPTPMTINSTSQRAQTGRLTAGPSRGGPSYGLEDVLLKTPTAQLAINGGSQHPDKRRAGGHGPTLADQVEHELLPTPNAARVGSRMDTQLSGDGRETPNKLGWAIGSLPPTPSATDGKGGSAPGERVRGDGRTRTAGDADLTEAVSLLPTPSVADGTGGHKTRSGDRKGEPLLGGIAMLLPTPTAMDSKGSRNATAGRNPDSAHHAGTTLSDVFWDGDALLPTPSAGNFNDGESLESWEARRQENLAKGVNGSGQGTPPPIAAQQLAGTDWGPYEAAIRRWEIVTGRPAPSPTVPGKTGARLNPALPEWMMGLPEGWITGVPGLSRNAQLKLAGNGCVPQQVALALAILLDRAGLAMEAGEAA